MRSGWAPRKPAPVPAPASGLRAPARPRGAGLRPPAPQALPLAVAAVALAALVAGAAPAAAQEAGPAVLYLHVGDPANTDDVPMSARPPPDAFQYRGPLGQGPAFSCPTVPPGGVAQESHRLYAIAYAREVGYEEGASGLQVEPALYGAARGLGYAVALQGEPRLTLYLETAPPASGEPIPVANVVVTAALREGEAAGAGPAGYDAGTLIAEGTSPPALLAGAQSRNAQVHEAGGRTVYNITVPLAVASRHLPEAGINLRVEVSVDNPACGTVGGSAALPLVRLHSSAGLRPRLELGVDEPLRVGVPEFSRDQFGTVRLAVPVVTAWGGYAVANASAAAAGPGPVVDTYGNLFVPGAGCPCEGQDGLRPAEPAHYFWGWRVRNDAAVPGPYHVVVTATDVAGNAATARAGFTLPAGLTETLRADDGPAAPGLGAAPVGLLLLAAGTVAAQRKRL